MQEQLSDLTDETPSIHTTEKGEKGSAPAPKAPAQVADRKGQYLLKIIRAQRRQLTKLAVMEDMTIRGFILNALKEKGLDETNEDMIDLRRTAE